jgi:hypothetical protein
MSGIHEAVTSSARATEALSMPSDERVLFYDCQHAAPIDQPRKHDERDPSHIVGPARLHLALPIQCELLP